MKPKSEFEKFNRVMRGLLAVPYSDLKKKLEEEKRGKMKDKKKRATSPASRVSSSRKK